MYYASMGLLASLILLIINFDVLFMSKKGKTHHAHRSYRQFLFSVLNYYITDIFWGFFYTPKIKILLYIDTLFYFAAMALSLFYWIRYIITFMHKKNVFFTILRYTGFIFLFFEFSILLVNFFYSVMFYFDEEGIYHPTNARYILMGVQFLLFLLISLYTLIITLRTHGKVKYRHRAIWLSGITMALFIFLQITNAFLPFYTIGFVIATCLIHTFVLEDEKETRREELERLLKVEEIQEQELGSARLMAYTDPLTGVKNKNAYLEDVCGIEKRMEDGILKEFGIIVFDVNGLKDINDTKGHEEGDRFIKSATKLICQTFKRSPIYRIGGDEFVAFLMGEDYKHKDELLSAFEFQIEKNKAEGKVVISRGFADFNQNETYLKLFERADQKMYENKRILKGII